MLIAILDVSVAQADREHALQQLSEEADTVRAMTGNIGFRALPAYDNATDITLLHEWRDAKSFEGYLASDAFARFGEVLRPIMTGKPVSRRFEATLLETVR